MICQVSSALEGFYGALSSWLKTFESIKAPSPMPHDYMQRQQSIPEVSSSRARNGADARFLGADTQAKFAGSWV